MREWEEQILSHIKNMLFYLVFLNVHIYLFNIVIVMIDIKKKIQAARDYASKSYRVIRKVSKNGFMVQRDKNADKHFLDGIDWAEKEIFKDLIHNANEVPQIGRGRILAYSRDCGYRNLYNLYDMMYKTDCGTYQEMWELEVKAYGLDGWIYADELFDLIIKGGECK